MVYQKIEFGYGENMGASILVLLSSWLHMNRKARYTLLKLLLEFNEVELHVIKKINIKPLFTFIYKKKGLSNLPDSPVFISNPYLKYLQSYFNEVEDYCSFAR